MQWHTLQQDWGKSRQGEEKGGYEGGEEWCWMYTQKPRRKEKGEKEERGSKMEK